MKSFAELLYAHVEARNESLRDFAARVGQQASLFSGIKSGKVPVPLGRVREWAQALRLEGVALDEFLMAAWLANSPPELVQWIQRSLFAAGTPSRVADASVGHDASKVDAAELTRLKAENDHLRALLESITSAVDRARRNLEGKP